MSDIQKIAKLIDSAGSRVFYLRYTKKSGEESEGVFHAQALKRKRGGVDSTVHLPHMYNLYNMHKQRWSKINVFKVTEVKVNGKTYKF